MEQRSDWRAKIANMIRSTEYKSGLVDSIVDMTAKSIDEAYRLGYKDGYEDGKLGALYDGESNPLSSSR